MTIPRVAHYVFGLKQQQEPFHYAHYVSIESCRRVVGVDKILFHHKHLPWGPWWERVRPHLTLVSVNDVASVQAADYSAGNIPARYRYAHHADFVRLDALIEHGGIYADIDTIFVRPFPDELFNAPFVIGQEPESLDERTGKSRASLCNALMLAQPGAQFARTWRERMPAALDGTWNNHSGFLAHELSRLIPSSVQVQPESRFFPFPPTRAGMAMLLQQRHALPAEALSVHLWAHLWWERGRRDFSPAHGGWCTPSFVKSASTTFADLARPYLPSSGARRRSRWTYLSLDEDSGYGVAGDRCMAALKGSGLEVSWKPFVPGPAWLLGYQPALALEDHDPVVVAHLPPDYLLRVRQSTPGAFLVAHTVWETDRLPTHWFRGLDAADLIVVPSRFSADTIASSPVNTPVAVVPHVAPAMGSGPEVGWTDVAADTLVFYTIAEWNERKAVFHTVEAYLRAFTSGDPVLLIIKTCHRDLCAGQPPAPGPARQGTTAWSLARLMARHSDPPAVQLITRALSEGEIRGLHRRGDVFVSLCRGEGWGVGTFDAAAYGNPVVTTGFGGHLDYLAGSPYLVDFELVPVIHPYGLPTYSPDQRWAEPDVEHGASLLRRIAGDREGARSHAASLAQEIGWRYRPAAIAQQFRAAVEQRRARGDQAVASVRSSLRRS